MAEALVREMHKTKDLTAEQKAKKHAIYEARKLLLQAENEKVLHNEALKNGIKPPPGRSDFTLSPWSIMRSLS